MKRSRYTSPRVGSYSQSSLESLWKLRRRYEPAEPLLVVGLRRRGIFCGFAVTAVLRQRSLRAPPPDIDGDAHAGERSAASAAASEAVSGCAL